MFLTILFQALQPPVLKTGTQSVIVICGLPQVPESESKKLKADLKTTLSTYGNVDYLYLAKNMTETLGFAYVDYEDQISAYAAVTALNGHKMYGEHSLHVITYDFFQELEQVTEKEIEEQTSSEFNFLDIRAF